MGMSEERDGDGVGRDAYTASNIQPITEEGNHQDRAKIYVLHEYSFSET